MATRIERKEQTKRRLQEVEEIERYNQYGVKTDSKVNIQVIEGLDLQLDGSATG